MISLSVNLISNQHARSSSSSQFTFRDLTSYVSTSIMSRITKNFFKKLSQLNKIYTTDEKFTSTDDNFDFKLRIFFNKYRRVELSSHAYMKEASFMLAKRALSHFYDNNYENITFDKFRDDMKKFFKESEWKRFNLTKWQFMHIDNVIAVNSNLSLTECLQKLCIDLDDVQKELNSDYHDSNQMRKILIRACRNHSILLIELHNSSSKFSDLINALYFNIVNYESINKKNNMYLQSIYIIDCTHSHDHNFIDKQYHREFESFNNRDNRKFLTNSRFRDRFSVRVSKKCFVRDKFNCDRQIIRKRNAMTSKSALRIVISNENRVRDLNVVWNHLSRNSKIIKMRISSFNSSKSWTSTSRSRSTIFRLMNSSLNSTARQSHFLSSSTRSMIRRQFLQSSSCSLTKRLRTNSSQWISSLFHRIRDSTSIMSSLRQDTTIANTKTY